MTILRAEVTWCISINIFGIDICFVLNKGLNHTQVSSKTGNVKRCSKIVGSCINLSLEFDQDLDHWSMALTRGKMQWGKAIRVGTVHDFKHFIVLVKLLFGIAQYFVHFVGVSLIYFCPVVHLDLLDVLFSLFLLR